MLSSNEPVACLPDRSIIIGVSHPCLAHWAERFAKAEPAGGVSDTASRVQELLQATDIEGDQDVVVIHAGWSDRDGAAVAFMFRRSRGFQPRRLDRGYAVYPELCSSVPGLGRIASMGSEVIGYGRPAQDYHAAVFDNHQKGYQLATRCGALPASSAYHLATVDAGYCGSAETDLELKGAAV